ncbi:MAG TPA: class I SAM-dependent methyltransferase [Phenylobacterium sp.]|nr:class I SAM-dependent methyltransferase [Phenylobacterium sp.]
MLERQPSRTALAVAGHRAAHQVLDEGRVFTDPLALTILGEDAKRAVETSRANPSTGGMRFFVAARAAIAETQLKTGVEARGVGQLVVLGAGLDTFAYRNPFADRLAVFEVDHPETQAWKRRRLAETGVPIPASLNYAPVDFERDDLMAALAVAGFDRARRTFFTWLGVVPYLTKPAIQESLSQIAAVAGGAEVVFDYSDPPGSLSKAAAASHRERAKRVAALGEPFLSYFEPAELHAQLGNLGLSEIEDLGPRALITRFHPGRKLPDDMGDTGGHVIFAATRRIS